MEQKEVTDKIISDLLTLEIIGTQDIQVIKNYLDQSYAAGYEFRSTWKDYSGKPVVKLDSGTGKEIKVYSSISMAAEREKVRQGTLLKAIRIGKVINGYIYKLL